MLQHQLGHAKVTTTTTTYLHLLDGDVEHAVRVAHGHAPAHASLGAARTRKALHAAPAA